MITRDHLIQAYGLKTQMCELPDSEVDSSGSILGQFLRQNGYDESPRRVFNSGYGWSLTVEEISEWNSIS